MPIVVVGCCESVTDVLRTVCRLPCGLSPPSTRCKTASPRCVRPRRGLDPHHPQKGKRPTMNATDNAVTVEQNAVFLMDLPAGVHWRRYEDVNLIVLASHLNKSGRALALIDAGRPDLI